MYNRYLITNQTGQGLLEAIVAVAVILVGVVSLVALSQSSVTTSNSNAYRLTAVNLAREGVEAVRAIRDNNWLAGKDSNWDDGLKDLANPLLSIFKAIPVLDTGNENVDGVWTLNFNSSLTLNSDVAKLKRLGVLYIQSNPAVVGADSGFSRILELTSISCPLDWDEICAEGKIGIKVVSKVQWQEGGQKKSISVEDWLYNWRF